MFTRGIFAEFIFIFRIIVIITLTNEPRHVSKKEYGRYIATYLIICGYWHVVLHIGLQYMLLSWVIHISPNGSQTSSFNVSPEILLSLQAKFVKGELLEYNLSIFIEKMTCGFRFKVDDLHTLNTAG